MYGIDLIVHQAIHLYGIFAVCLFLFAETGLLLGVFLPGDTLLLFVGVYATQGDINLFLLIPCAILASFIGNLLGYLLGEKIGGAVFVNDDAVVFKKSHLTSAHKFFKKYGPISILIAKFIGYLRTFVPFVAGMGTMDFASFALYSFIGSVFWVTSFIALGYLVGKRFQHFLHVIDIALLLVLFVPLVVVVLGVVVKKIRKNQPTDPSISN